MLDIDTFLYTASQKWSISSKLSPILCLLLNHIQVPGIFFVEHHLLFCFFLVPDPTDMSQFSPYERHIWTFNVDNSDISPISAFSCEHMGTHHHTRLDLSVRMCPHMLLVITASQHVLFLCCIHEDLYHVTWIDALTI